MTQSFDVLIVGSGHAGAQAAVTLRQLKFEGSIAMVSEDAEAPYDRPPLSKEYLAGEKPFERILLRKPDFWAERDIVLIPGRGVEAVDAARHTVCCSDGSDLGYAKLIWAAGGHARRLPCEGGDLRGVHSIRSRADVDAIMAELDEAKHIAIVGGGYIGLEAAAAFRKYGKNVTVLEAQERVLARVAGEDLSRFYEREHRANGVDIRTDVLVERLEGAGGRISGIGLADGSTVPADLAIVGIGIDPATGPLVDAGAKGGNGVQVDTHCRTSLADVYAAGDCALHANRYAGGAMVRLESVQNANDQAATAARHIAGRPAPYEAVPWFWSNQYDLRLQTVGLNIGYEQTVLRGDPAARSFAVVYLRGGRVIALDCVNATKDYVQGRKLVETGARFSEAQLADADVPLKALVN